MTAFNAVLEKEYVIIATDTLSCMAKKAGDKELKPLKFMSKTFYLPHFKSMFAVTGISEFALSFFSFMSFNAYGTDIDSITNIDLIHFKTRWESDIDKFDELKQSDTISNINSTIYLFGFSNNENKFKGFKLHYNGTDEMKWHEFNTSDVITKPEVLNLQHKIVKFGHINNQHEFLINIIKVQKEEDERTPFINQVGIGGEIQLSYLYIDNNGKITFDIKNIYQFSDYFKICGEMARNLYLSNI